MCSLAHLRADLWAHLRAKLWTHLQAKLWANLQAQLWANLCAHLQAQFCPMFVFVYFWLPLATIYLVDDNREFEISDLF